MSFGLIKTLFIVSFLSLSKMATAAELTLDELLNRAANPLTYQTSLLKNSATRLITAKEGGQISLKGSDGTLYTLTFPAKSVPFDLNITMTETKDSKLNGSVFQFFGVQLYPDGLELNQPAILEIITAKVINSKTLSLLTSKNNGSQTHTPYLKSISPQSIELSLFHFSNYAVSDDEKVQEIVDLGMADTESIRITNWFNQQVLKQKTGIPNDEFQNLFRQKLKEMIKRVVIPKMSSARTCTGSRDALKSYLVAERQAALIQISMSEILDSNDLQSLNDVLALTSTLCLNEARQFCNVEHNIPEAFKIWLSLSKYAAIFGNDNWLLEINQAAEKCMKFKFFMQTDFKIGEDEDVHGFSAISEFDFNFTIAGTLVSAVGFLNENGGTQPVYNFKQGQISVVDTYVNFDSMTCTQSSFTKNSGIVQVDNFLGDVIASRKPALRIANPSPQFRAQYVCRDPESGFSFPFELPPNGSDGYFLGVFIATHGPTGLNEMNEDAVFELKKAEFLKGSKYVEAVYNHVVEDSIQEVTTITIHHTPE